MGSRGPEGLQGSKGDKGVSGTDGPRGPKGDRVSTVRSSNPCDSICFTQSISYFICSMKRTELKRQQVQIRCSSIAGETKHGIVALYLLRYTNSEHYIQLDKPEVHKFQ